MRTMLAQVRALIEEAADTDRVFHAWPSDWAKTPCVSYREEENRAYARADGVEALTELVYAVDVWAVGAQQARDLLARIDGALCGAGFARTQATMLFEERTRFYHVSSRYRILTDGAGVYQ
ncbi:MAG TPA: DUF3168 domain-containing protein [Candidatus Pullichristensenella avicola]|nr:DUF3168 domain-containing protein [Candidatus Pullichristensenella avicola]